MASQDSKGKGSTFERLVAEKILEAAGPAFGKKDCYRTPMSGGHPYGDRGDLTSSGRLMAVFPYVVECKHYSGWHLESMLYPRETEKWWVAQVTKAAEGDSFTRIPLLVIRGNNTRIIAVRPLPWDMLPCDGVPFMTTYEQGEWAVLLFSDFLKLVFSKE